MKCESCNFKSHRLILQADTDMVYMGVMGLTDLKRKRIVITHLNRFEWNHYKEAVPKKLEDRINRIFNVDSFKNFSYEKIQSNHAEQSKLRIVCPECSGTLTKERYLSFDEFIEQGGEIITMDEYK